MSPIFETAADRANEAAIIEVLEDAWGCEIKGTDTLNDLDFHAYKDGQLVSIGEIKCRKVHSTKYGGKIYFDVDKAIRLQTHADELGVPAVIVLKYTDGLFWYKVSDLRSWPAKKARRTDRGNADRLQLAYVVPHQQMHRINTTREV